MFSLGVRVLDQYVIVFLFQRDGSGHGESLSKQKNEKAPALGSGGFGLKVCTH